MSDIRFGWLGESRRTAMCALIADEVMDWSREWRLHHSPEDVGVQALDDLGFDIGPVPFVSLNESGSLAFFLHGKTFDSIGRYLAGTVEEEAAGWAQRIGEDALQDLVVRVCQRAGITGPAKLRHAAAPPELLRRNMGSCMTTVALGWLQFVLIVDRRLGERLTPPSAIDRMSLTPRRAALDGIPLRVNAIIDFGSVSLTHLSDLRVGEILVGEQGLEEPLDLHVEGHGAIATAYLRRMGAQRAVMLDGVNSQDKQP